MSSPVMTPPPIAPVPPRRNRSFAGPFVLIVVGIVFLLGTMRVLSVGRLAHLFASYWPVLLIIWGVIKLVEHMQAQRRRVMARVRPRVVEAAASGRRRLRSLRERLSER